MRCPYCGHDLAPSAKVCYNCGYNQEETMKNVENLGFVPTIIILIISLVLGFAIVMYLI